MTIERSSDKRRHRPRIQKQKTEATDPRSFDHHTPRTLPVEDESTSLSGEIAALLNRQARLLRNQEEQHANERQAAGRATARAMQLVFHLEQAVNAGLEAMDGAGLGRDHQRIRIIKDQLKAQLNELGYRWRDPNGERYTEQLGELVEVDGWRYAAQYQYELIVETREPIVLYCDLVVLTGAVIVGAPE